MARSKAKKEDPVEAGSDVDMEEAPTSHQPENADDMSVDHGDDDEEEEGLEEEEDDEEDDVQRVRLVCQTLNTRRPWFAGYIKF